MHWEDAQQSALQVRWAVRLGGIGLRGSTHQGEKLGVFDRTERESKATLETRHANQEIHSAGRDCQLHAKDAQLGVEKSRTVVEVPSQLIEALGQT